MKAPSFLTSDWVKARLYHLFAPLVALILVWAFLPTRLAQQLEYLTVNLRFQARAPFDPPADPRLFFVGIDQQSLDLLGKWPWPRLVEARFLDTLALSGLPPRAVAFDILFTEPSPDDTVLADSASQLPNVITGAITVAPFVNPEKQQEQEKQTQADLADLGLTASYPTVHGDIARIGGSDIAKFPVLPLRKQSLFGFVDDTPSSIDHVRHTIPLVIRVQNQLYPSLALQTLCQLLHVDADQVEITVGSEVKLKNATGKTWTIPIDVNGEFTINYRAETSFAGCSIADLEKTLGYYIKDPKKYPIPARSNIKGKVLIVGETAVGLTDLGPTPLQSQSPLAYTHLNVLNNVLNRDYLRFVPEFWVVLGWSLVTWFSILRLKDALLIEAVFVPIGVMILYTAAAFAIFWLWSLQIELAWPLISYGIINFGGVVLRWREEQKGRQQIKQLFSRMLSPELLNHLLEHPENLKMGGSERAVTTLFSDIRDYTKFSEGLAPSEVVRQLNIYFARMVGCVKENGGRFDKFIGDAVMAAWGDLPATSLGVNVDARNAVRAALQMRVKLTELNIERQTAGLSPLRIGIGLNHGIVLAGLIGAEGKSDFTVMGDEVNVASRLEGMTKEFHTNFAISESVRDLIGDDFIVRRLGLVVLKGKTKPIVVYEVLAEKTAPANSRLPLDFIARYEEAFDHFLARRFAEAETGFLVCEKILPGDYCVNEYLDASREFLVTPPAPDWDGRIVMKTK